MKISQKIWILIMGCIYVGCIGIALTGARPNVSNTLTVIWLISAFTVCLVAPTIEWFLQAMYTTASYELNLKVLLCCISFLQLCMGLYVVGTYRGSSNNSSGGSIGERCIRS